LVFFCCSVRAHAGFFRTSGCFRLRIALR
jgi:hypothetical protein